MTKTSRFFFTFSCTVGSLCNKLAKDIHFLQASFLIMKLKASWPKLLVFYSSSCFLFRAGERILVNGENVISVLQQIQRVQANETAKSCDLDCRGHLSI